MNATVAVPLAELRQAVGLFGFDVLGGWGASSRVRRWHSPTDRKDYADRENGRHRVRPKHLLAHLAGETALAVAPITRALVIDADVIDLPSAQEAPEAMKLEGACAVSELLGSLGLPHVTFDSAGGFHTYVRLSRDPNPCERHALLAHLAGLADRERLPFKFEVFPDGEKPIRLPFGVYLGRARGTIGAPEGLDPLRWLAWPERATDEQLAALVATAPDTPAVQRPPPTRPRLWTPDPPVIVVPPAAPGPLGLHWEASLPAFPVAIVPRLRRAVRMLAIHGCQIVGLSDLADLLLFNELSLAGETDPDVLAEAILSVDHPVSRTDKRQRERRVRWVIANYKPIPSGCCQLHPIAEGRTERARMRDTIRQWCDVECARTCHIYNRRSVADVTEGFGRVARASFWMDGRGKAGNYPGTGTFGPNGYGIWQYVVRTHQDVPGASVLADPTLFARRLNIHHKTASRQLNAQLAHGLLGYTDRSRRELRAIEPSESAICRIERETGGTARARAREIRAEEARKRLDALWDRRMQTIFGWGR